MDLNVTTISLSGLVCSNSRQDRNSRDVFKTHCLGCFISRNVENIIRGRKRLIEVNQEGTPLFLAKPIRARRQKSGHEE